MKKIWITIAAAAMLLAGCSSNSMSEIKDPKTPASAYKPTLELRQEVSGNKATIYITTDLKMSQEHYGKERKSGEGHIHLYVDEGEKVIWYGDKYVTPELTPGKHTVNISLHNNDHTPYDIAKKIDFIIP